MRAFYNNQYRENPYKLEGVDEALKDKTYGLLDGDARRTLDNTFIHATIVRNEPSPDGYRAVYQLFERLNTGGTNLQPQEIRVALFHGRFVGLLRELNDDKNWRHLYGKRSERLKDQELILRFFALFHTRKNYERPLKFFLNSYMEANQDSPESECDSNLRLFELTSESIRSGIGLRAFRIRRNLNAALCDAIMVGVADRLSRGPIADLPGLSKAYDVLLQDAEFLASITSATANEESVSLRLSRASKAFARVK